MKIYTRRLHRFTGGYVSFFFFFFHFIIYSLCPTSPQWFLQLPPSYSIVVARNPGPQSGHSSPPSRRTAVREYTFVARRLQHLLSSSFRVELCIHRLQLLVGAFCSQFLHRNKGLLGWIRTRVIDLHSLRALDTVGTK